MKNATMPRPARLSRVQLNELRGELEREQGRLTPLDVRHHVFTEALRRLDDGTYGACLACGNAIPFGRLSVMPETVYCVTCGAKS